MTLHELRLVGFRAHADTNVAFAPRINLLYGRNGSGKTNVLEAIHYLCLSKSFLASRDTYVLRKGADFFEIEGRFSTDQGLDRTVRLVYMPDEGKRIFLDGAPLERLSDIVGKIPVVVFCPSDQAITAGGPSERRDFVNNTLSQAHPVYLDDLMKYRRVWKQRNALLKELAEKPGRPDTSSLEAWDDRLVRFGAKILRARLRFLDAFAEHLEEAYRRMEAVGERPTITYDSLQEFTGEEEEEELAEVFRQELARVRDRELNRGTTVVGPHRDEFVFRLNDMKVRRYGSQGQHRTFGMALKLAKHFYLLEHLEEHPVLLLDDVFGDLDSHRTEVFLNLLDSELVGQSILTAVEKDSFEAVVPFGEGTHAERRVAEGSVTATSDRSDLPRRTEES